MAVYEYGYGAPYATPQEAVDALFAELGEETPFTEHHYIRGREGIYPCVSTPMVLLPNFFTTANYCLVFDTVEGATVEWTARNDGDVFFAWADGAVSDRIRIKGIRFNDAGHDEVHLFDGDGSTLRHVCYLDDCYFDISGSLFNNALFITIGMTYCKGQVGNFCNQISSILSIFNSCLVSDTTLLSGLMTIITVLVTFHSAIKVSDGWIADLTYDGGAYINVTYNSCLIAPSGIWRFNSDYDVNEIPSPFTRDYNIYNTAGDIIYMTSQSYSLPHVRARWGTDEHSFVNTNIDITDDFELTPYQVYGKRGGYLGGDALNARRYFMPDIGHLTVGDELYTDVKTVLALSGIEREDLGFDDEIDFENFVWQSIAQVSRFIDSYTQRQWSATDETVSALASRIVANYLVAVNQRRKSPYIQVGDFSIKALQDSWLTSEIEGVLRQLRRIKLGVST